LQLAVPEPLGIAEMRLGVIGDGRRHPLPDMLGTLAERMPSELCVATLPNALR
jgi:hypothetical protein